MSTSHIRAIALVLMCAGLACSPGRTADLPEGLWDAHTHLTYWGVDALDSLTKYGVVGVPV